MYGQAKFKILEMIVNVAVSTYSMLSTLVDDSMVRLKIEPSIVNRKIKNNIFIF